MRESKLGSLSFSGYFGFPMAFMDSATALVTTNSVRPATVDYDPAEHREKHCWAEPRADFVMTGVGLIGKCPSTLSKAKARELLNDAEFEGKEPNQTVAEVRPDRAWNVFEGVVYEAVPSGPGAYHGYPWRGRPTRNRLARSVKRALEKKAEEQGFGRQFRDWLDRYES